MEVNDIIKLKARLEKAQRESDALRGRQEQILQSLKKEFKIRDIKEAKSRIKELEDQISSKKTELETMIQKFEEAYGNLL